MANLLNNITSYSGANGMNEIEELKAISDSFLSYALHKAPEDVSYSELFNSWIRDEGITIQYENNFRWAVEFARNFKGKILPCKKTLIIMLQMVQAKGD